ncbi:hypothetical protein A3F27_02385 [Candidatus Kaiserbacteria bacterium RIFCSPHIGHO2_12_FULL_53_13]|uniref:DoxX family protein n=1 Tax=Candidatus Kaiserbacteria bacterium RIFCSPHIGHO2_12_FULL_53_13 TaxID=1798502 RepID=A0A1F6E6H9_9BACT|nr:MAG: hypothetical protein A3F27_02385 [Candidatus Kaiserbacteria bacterium RIFCSPHIGHO2_12_FULL_53_13]
MTSYTREESVYPHFFFTSTRSSIMWFVVRVYVGWIWLEAGLEKIQNPAWVGDSSGAALTGFVQGALKKTAEFCAPAPAACHPDVQSWYAVFLENAILANPVLLSNLVAWGEVLVGVALILGFLVGISAFFGSFMNFNFMLAGSVSINPYLFVAGILLMLAWRTAGYWGLDRFILPMFGRRPHS